MYVPDAELLIPNELLKKQGSVYTSEENSSFQGRLAPASMQTIFSVCGEDITGGLRTTAPNRQETDKAPVCITSSYTCPLTDNNKAERLF